MRGGTVLVEVELANDLFLDAGESGLAVTSWCVILGAAKC